ncbi:hypothetical protein Tco_0930085 [Tanacetum coccineum]
MSALNLNEPIYSASFIIHSESASGNVASAASTAEAEPGKSAPSDFLPKQQGMNEGTKNTSYDYLFAGTNPHVLADQTKSISEGLETVLTQPRTRKGASFIARQIKEEEASNIIKLEDLEKLVSNVQPSFKDLDSPEYDPVIVVDDSDEDEEDEVHTTTEDTSSQKHNLEIKKNKGEAEVALLKAQSLCPIMGQLNELLELPVEFLSVPNQVASVHAKLKTLDALPSLLLKVTQALNMFAKVLHSATSKVRDQCVPSASQASTMPAEGEKNTNQATIS